MPQNWRKSKETLLPLEDRRHLDEDLGRHVQCFEISTAGNHANRVAGSRLAKLLHSGFQVTYQEVHSVKFVERQGFSNTTYHIISLLDAKLSCTNHKMLRKLHKFLTTALMRLISFFSAIMHYIMLLQRKLLHKNNTYIIIINSWLVHHDSIIFLYSASMCHIMLLQSKVLDKYNTYTTR